ncbi:hypothetical protein LTR10_014857 [Elasticomyces elasticus]|uniref:CENP-V/GFA domain-containing protein n=1 Tax=Exophiala sideris TaxID=1016849 RepID=A0ABR0JFR8_9EURO|nr:hypothetical protein LTR10_014857 [Elasticomyces elasticus]KAK5025700.1 hypothetical protein LTS07_007904 [Exophiala sideris]KAK5033090.1 hypothetical protein LTR13_007055 [Exophiala sideris]KAK5063575.1 hypothetical protein LTR69_004281 [Exophiala sideris]KAK5180591.1 hypothetical protein LTR44_006905 [Eurotiomycetes sp. CCFEE 6388]
MSTSKPLQGTCNCGRNHYAVVVPENAKEQAQVFFDDSSESRRSQGTPLTAWLRVPLAWYSSSTQAFFPDETHSSIRRTFSPLHSPHTQRIFCGYCGTHLTFWSEQPASEADFLNITLGSLVNEDIRALQDLELVPGDIDPEDVRPSQGTTEQAPVKQRDDQTLSRTERNGTSGGLSWFEEMLDGSKLGRTHNIRRGVGVTSDGTTRVEWEVSEYVDDGKGETNQTGSKRKIDDVGNDDVRMQE